MRVDRIELPQAQLSVIVTQVRAPASARPVSTTEWRCRPSPKRYNLLAPWALQHATPKCFLPTVYPALPCVVW